MGYAYISTSYPSLPLPPHHTIIIIMFVQSYFVCSYFILKFGDNKYQISRSVMMILAEHNMVSVPIFSQSISVFKITFWVLGQLLRNNCWLGLPHSPQFSDYILIFLNFSTFLIVHFSIWGNYRIYVLTLFVLSPIIISSLLEYLHSLFFMGKSYMIMLSSFYITATIFIPPFYCLLAIY